MRPPKEPRRRKARAAEVLRHQQMFCPPQTKTPKTDYEPSAKLPNGFPSYDHLPNKFDKIFVVTQKTRDTAFFVTLTCSERSKEGSVAEKLEETLQNSYKPPTERPGFFENSETFAAEKAGQITFFVGVRNSSTTRQRRKHPSSLPNARVETTGLSIMLRPYQVAYLGGSKLLAAGWHMYLIGES
ncbi:hypothetical protein G7Y89_g7697 [Cudoniella acicularis]|uniref:Uncharacterized protein n=1 Tax=Cudoniella acicularis TaxID=354080 RepID=A0A8H4RIT6_9HELO|nr:hypothetical protein G7Y89_g7697 [Cudoniella acicularis]